MPMMAWTPPLRSSIPSGQRGDSIRFGESIFDDTPLYAARYSGAKIGCSSCHAEGGIEPYASPMVGLPALCPMFNARADHVISIKDYIQECFVRSENGRPLPDDSPEMKGLVDHISWLSQPRKGAKPFVGGGLVDLPILKPDLLAAGQFTHRNVRAVTERAVPENHHCSCGVGRHLFQRRSWDERYPQDGSLRATQHAPKPRGNPLSTGCFRHLSLHTRLPTTRVQQKICALLGAKTLPVPVPQFAHACHTLWKKGQQS